MKRKIHRWQLGVKTPCGRLIVDVHTNVGYYLDDGVTCKACRQAPTRISLLHDRWNGESDGYPDCRQEIQ